MVINDDARQIIDAAKLTFVATVSTDGSPNLSPKGSVRVYDDEHLIFMDIASPTTIANLRQDPRIEICVVDFHRRQGYRFKGTAEILDIGEPAYQWLHEWLLTTNGPGYPANQAVMVSVQRVLEVKSPAYTWGGATEEQLDEAWRRTYATNSVASAEQPE